MCKVEKVTDIDMAFGRIEGLLPKREDIPKEFFKDWNQWNNIASQWFFGGLKAKFKPKAEINQEDALRHVTAILSSFEPSHEHKIAGCAYLLHEFFEEITLHKETELA